MFSLLLSFVSAVVCQNYILFPKYDNLDLNELSSTLNLQHFATIDSTHFFSSSHNNVLKNRNILSQHFHIEEDHVVSINSNRSNFVLVSPNPVTVPWHLDRIVQRELPLDNSFPYQSYCHTNDNITINTYIVDTGIDISHPEFQGRASWGANFADSQNTDCNNHGTHVSGLVGSFSYGVCTDANLIAVKVLDCEGSGSTSGVIKGIEWSFNSHLQQSQNDKDKTVKSIISMSLGGGYSRALNKALEVTLRNHHFYVVVAAGNENNDACDTSPASSKSVLTVMASDIHDNRAWFSNWGKCANIYAPGVDILSTIPNNEIASYSGTSMATPIVTGVLNHYLVMYPELNMQQIVNKLSSDSTSNVIKGTKPQTLNKLVYLYRELK
jgi:cerevisin